MQFETVTSKDLAGIRLIQPEGWSDIIPDFKFYIQSPFCHPIKTEVDGAIAGVGAAITFNRTSWLAHIIVGSSYRNQGIGFQMVQHLLNHLKKESIETCSLIATDFGFPVYIKAGFKTVTEYTFLKKDSAWIDQPASKNIIPFQEEHRAAVFALDQQISGEQRQSLITRFLNQALVYIENGKVTGYYLPDLREGMIFAQTEEAGLALMNLKYATAEHAVLPSDNTSGIRQLRRNGFIETGKKGTRMILGNELAWQPQKIYSRIGGNLG